MNKKRYDALMGSNAIPLSVKERKAGWHFCCEFDGLLVGPGMIELKFCQCLPDEHPVYETAPPLEPEETQLPAF